MGAAVFLGLVVFATALIVLTAYAVCVGIATLIGMRRHWRRAAKKVATAPSATERAGDAKRGWTTDSAYPMRPQLVPCWEEKRCRAEQREACPAFKRPEEPCWLALMRANYDLKTECLICSRFDLSAYATLG